MPRAESPPCQCHLSASKEAPPWGHDPSLCGVLGCREPAAPSKGAGEALACCQGCHASSHPCCCLTVKGTRYKAAIRGKSWCSASVQHTGFPLLLSTVHESLNMYLEFPTGPLSLASRELMDWWEAGVLGLAGPHAAVSPLRSCQPYQNDGCYPGVSQAVCQNSCSTQPPASVCFSEKRTLSSNMLRKVQIYL